MTNDLKLISLNIWAGNYIDRVLSFLKKENAHVICLQEMLECDMSIFETELDMKGVFVPMAYIKENTFNIRPDNYFGLAIFSKHEIINSSNYYYQGSKDKITIHIPGNSNSLDRILLVIDINAKGKLFRIITTHFTWSAEAKATDLQRNNLAKMLLLLKSLEPFILCGDFNAPRGGEIHKRLSSLYKDNIPEDINTTLDENLHKNKNLRYVVDGLFTCKEYSACNVRIIGGLSDHKAIVASINRAV